MTNESTMKQSFLARFSKLRDNTTVIDNSELLNFTKVEDGVLIVYASWSGQGIFNCTQTIKTLYELNYNGQIITIDNDCMTPEFQIKMFGKVCHGWGEIFTILNGKINQKYLGKDSYINYKADYFKNSD